MAVRRHTQFLAIRSKPDLQGSEVPEALTNAKHGQGFNEGDKFWKGVGDGKRFGFRFCRIYFFNEPEPLYLPWGQDFRSFDVSCTQGPTLPAYLHNGLLDLLLNAQPYTLRACKGNAARKGAMQGQTRAENLGP